MSTTALTIAVILYGVVTVALVAYFVHEASAYARKWQRTAARLAAAYRREADLEHQLELKADTIYQLRQQLAKPAALDDEPPAGSIVAVSGSAPWIRDGLPGAPWSKGYEDKAWTELWTSDMLILRWGWESDHCPAAAGRGCPRAHQEEPVPASARGALNGGAVMAQSFLLVGGQIHMDPQCALIQPTGGGLEAYVLCTPSTLIALRNRDVDNCPLCVRPPA